MRILKYSEALQNAKNKDWFRNFYKEEEICSDIEVENINNLASKFKTNPLCDYFETKENIMLQKEYYETTISDLEEMLEETKEN